MFWPLTKTLIPIEVGYELIIEVLKPPFEKHKAAFKINSVVCIMNPPQFKKLQELRPLKDQKPQIPDYTGTSFTDAIYTKLSALSSRKMSGGFVGCLSGEFTLRDYFSGIGLEIL